LTTYTSQFFVNLGRNPNLNHRSDRPGYAVFGKIRTGMDVVQRIASMTTGIHGRYKDVPVQDVPIISISRRSSGDKAKNSAAS
jgi:cyclophilin family peptidyl-prolyl cis-trans isomerase